MRPPPPTAAAGVLLTLALLMRTLGGGVIAAPLVTDHSRHDQVAATRQAPADRAGTVRPVPGAVVRHFEAPQGPYGAGHRGVDLAARHADPVRSALGGTVVFSGTVAGVGWVTVDHGARLVTTYGPLRDRVASGSVVTAGQVVGSLDRPDEPGAVHLDWGARLDGAYIDPLRLLARWRLRLTVAPRCADSAQGC